MHTKLNSILISADVVQGDDGIYSAQMPLSSLEQQAERDLRERVVSRHYDNYLDAISRSHSITVMDREVDRFLDKLPNGAVILDIGGCWGWHWRRLATTRPDVGVIIVDFVRANLHYAMHLLGKLVGTQVALIHADATALPFCDGNADGIGFNGVWTVQVFQHIPDFACACHEAHRVLKVGGYFLNYSLHATPLNQLIYRLLGKKFHLDGMMRNDFYLTRANDDQRQIVARIFRGEVLDRYTECLFHPDLKLYFTGRLGSYVARLDSRLGNLSLLGRLIARQRSFEAIKI
jgi:ubiquinone/menaquinone biosynthesis C-methylase UbiE